MIKRNVFTLAQETWLKSLESEEYRQTKGTLMKEKGKTKSYCCLGVASQLSSRTEDLERLGEEDVLSVGLQEKLFLRDQEGSFYRDFAYGYDKFNRPINSLAMMNDSGKKFKTIAKFIRANPWYVFSNFDSPKEMETNK